MRTRLTLILFLAACVTAYAQYPSFSMELGTGITPLHMSLVSMNRAANEELAQYGQQLGNTEGYNTPVLSLSGVWRFARRSEMLLTAGLAWRISPVIQYPEFGVDPEGKPRYLVQDGTEIGWKSHSFVPSINLIYRHLWNPDHLVVAYSGAGWGFTTATEWIPLPTLVPIAFRIGGRHFYTFLELMVGPVATLAHGGLAWRF